MDKTTSNSSKFMSYEFRTSAFGAFNIVWQETQKGPKVHRVFLPSEKTSAKELAQRTFVDLMAQGQLAMRYQATLSLSSLLATELSRQTANLADFKGEKK